MKTLALVNGDLAIGGADGYQTYSGAPKIRQDLALGLIEEYGNDPYHPSWGSLLPRYIGEAIDDDMPLIIRVEVQRIVENYMTTQLAEINKAAREGRQTRYTTADVVASIRSVKSVQDMDTIRVSVSLTTAAGQDITISRLVTT